MKRKIAALLTLIIVLLFAVVGCEQGPRFTFENRSTQAVKILFDIVPIETTEPYDVCCEQYDVFIEPLESDTYQFVGNIYSRREANYFKFIFHAVARDGSLVDQRVFTWFQLEALDRIVTITGKP